MAGNEWFDAYIKAQKTFKARKKHFYAEHANDLRIKKETLKDFLCLLVSGNQSVNARLLTEGIQSGIFEWLQETIQTAFNELVAEGTILVDEKGYCHQVPYQTPRLGAKERFTVLRKDNFRCRLCGAAREDSDDVRLHVDHITPRSRGGTNNADNLWTLCADCNIGKGTQEL